LELYGALNDRDPATCGHARSTFILPLGTSAV
jgi:hypothetical protein